MGTRAGIQETMTSFRAVTWWPPSLWSVIDESTGRIICELTTPCSTPRRHAISATNISVITYAVQWPVVPSRRHLQPVAVPAGGDEAGVARAQELGTDEDAARWMRRHGTLNERTQAGHWRERLPGFARDSPASRRRLRAPQQRVRAMARPNTRSTTIYRSPDSTATSSTPPPYEAIGCDDVYYRGRHQRLVARSLPLFRTTWQACATSSMRPQTPACAGSSSTVMRRWVVAWDTAPKKTGWILQGDSLRAVPAAEDSKRNTRIYRRSARRRDVSSNHWQHQPRFPAQPLHRVGAVFGRLPSRCAALGQRWVSTMRGR